MKRLIILFVFCSCIMACHEKEEHLTIDGTLRTDRSFDGEILYLMPMSGATPENRDSAIVKDGRFTFYRKVDSTDVCIIRAKNFAQSYFLQPLLVVTEPGVLEVRLDSASYAKGTPLNDILQEWKEYKFLLDKEEYTLRQQIRKAKGADKAELERQLVKQKDKISDYNYTFVKKNIKNPVGQFVYKQMKILLTPEQIQELEHKDNADKR
ncbi:hypothetical protein M2459_001224 [Parabacteroides sp. PF5-5]|uniref:DUF4369 domain-containing protein n=1 Tax=unclassified Parabacteroides TaxID=2649774 RepID=UPI0024756223|nr:MULTISPECIES: DUF4369 domain-containing protein [unclassified Parabacteroides]MDH6304491.1 hypothetical protein [Parabacteroides sp. PH5-39]MDH6315356.1 hypothetical protein [Parabacteroides sp. PF5-13]MDH6319150.1 hypothetical protein [Parabacteroides sp. PH5-13]MDH6322880.1 hypothetical protein [Parabacteroides sp. PH5-8]MDH6326548.1 hypothetical protein [Parabacteroides sp. PH5-41]